jgi:hypothetical protein
VTRFGNQVTQISDREDQVSYLWSSGSLFISVTKERTAKEVASVAPEIAAAEEDILRLYLEKFPSDL